MFCSEHGYDHGYNKSLQIEASQPQKSQQSVKNITTTHAPSQHAQRLLLGGVTPLKLITVIHFSIFRKLRDRKMGTNIEPRGITKRHAKRKTTARTTKLQKRHCETGYPKRNSEFAVGATHNSKKKQKVCCRRKLKNKLKENWDVQEPRNAIAKCSLLRALVFNTL